MIAAIVVTFNRKELLLKGLESLINQTHTLDALYIIDNASTDGTHILLQEKGFLELPTNPEKISGEFIKKITIPGSTEKTLDIHYIRLKENTGGTGGFYAGVKKVYEDGFEWLWIMDDDVRPDLKCLENLVNYMDNKKVLIPVRLSNKNEIVDFTAIKYNLRNPFLKDARESALCTEYKNIDDLPEIMEVHDFSFEGPMINREIVEKIGFPRADLFIFGDDTDYALRIRYLAKQELTLLRDARIYRMLDFVTSKETNWKSYYMIRNVFYMNWKYGQNLMVKLKPIFLFAGIFLKNLLMLNFKKIKIAFYALIDSYKKDMPLRFLPGSKI